MLGTSSQRSIARHVEFLECEPLNEPDAEALLVGWMQSVPTVVDLSLGYSRLLSSAKRSLSPTTQTEVDI